MDRQSFIAWSAFRHRVAAVLIALSLTAPVVLTTTSSEARTLLPIVGTAHGDHTVVATCPNGQELVGLTGRAGWWIDQVRLVCATPQFGGGFSSPIPTGDFLGGEGGGALTRTCDPMSRLHGVRIGLMDTGKQVYGITLVCITPDGRETMLYFTSGSEQRDLEFQARHLPLQSCPEQAFTGFTARFGNDVNSIGFICDATPMPVRVVGRPH